MTAHKNDGIRERSVFFWKIMQRKVIRITHDYSNPDRNQFRYLCVDTTNNFRRISKAIM